MPDAADPDDMLRTSLTSESGHMTPAALLTRTARTAWRARARMRRPVVAALLAGVCLLLAFRITGELAGHGLGGTLGDADPRWLLVAGAMTAVGYGLAGQAVRGACAQRLPKHEAALLPYGCAAANRVLPGGTGAIAVTTRVLTARGLPVPAATAIAAAAALATALAGTILLATGAILAATGVVPVPGPHLAVAHPPVAAALIAVVAVVAGLAGAGWLLRHRLARCRARAAGWRAQLPGPAVLARFTALEIIARLAQVATLIACTAAVGQQLDVGPALVVLAVGGLVGGLIPIAGGGGSVEVTLALALHTAGMSHPAAAAAAVLTRLIGYWAPALFGLPCLAVLLSPRRLAARRSAATTAADTAQPPLAAVPHPRPALLCAALACAVAATAAVYG